MPISIVIERDGAENKYEVPEPLTYRELGKIKRMTGLRGGEIGEALFAGDTDAVLALAVVSSERANDPISMDELEDLPFGAIRVEAEDDEDPTPAVAADDASDGQDAPTTPEAGGTPA